MTIDAHHHLWIYDAARYPWIGDGMEVLQRDYLVDDLSHELDAAGIDGAITVQARQDVIETEWLIGVARDAPQILGVVGWADLTAENLADTLDRLAPNPMLVGIRHVLQDEPDEAFALRADFNRGVSLLQDYGLAYDILVYEQHLPNVTAFVDRHPNQTFVVDHLAKPRIRDRDRRTAGWKADLTALARRPHCYCKLSGVVTEADWTHWRADDLDPYLDVALDAFGPDRLMFGSDWPVCLLACEYADWFDLMQAYTAPLSMTERARIWGETAAEAYRLAV